MKTLKACDVKKVEAAVFDVDKLRKMLYSSRILIGKSNLEAMTRGVVGNKVYSFCVTDPKNPLKNTYRVVSAAASKMGYECKMGKSIGGSKAFSIYSEGNSENQYKYVLYAEFFYESGICTFYTDGMGVAKL